MKPGDLVWFKLNWQPFEYPDRLGVLIALKSLRPEGLNSGEYAEILHVNKIWKISLDWVRPHKKEEDNEES